MPHICPRPCSRLATAAVFISVGVVQFVVGIILLRSEYVFLLAGPDFLTSACNIAVGCILGITASVWKRSRRCRTKESILKRNLLLALLFSALIMNFTTLGIFLLGEGNTLLSIRLENGGKYNSTFASEVLAYAYATSVCCPIVCIVITIVSMAGSFFKYAARKSSVDMKTVNTLKKECPRPLRWVYTPELSNHSKKKTRDFILTSSSDSLSDEDLDIFAHRRRSNSAEDMHVLNRMTRFEQNSTLGDRAIMLQEMNLRHKRKFDSLNRDGSYLGPILLRTRESVLSETQPRDPSIQFDDSVRTRIKTSRSDSDFGNSCLPSNDATTKRMNFSRSKQLGMLYNNPYTSEELVNEYQNAASKLSKHYPSQYKKFRENLGIGSDRNEQEIGDIPGIHRKPARISEVDFVEVKNLSTEYKDQKSRRSSVKFREDEKHEAVIETVSPNHCLSLDDSEFGDDSPSDVSRRNSWAGEIIPINIKHSSALKLSHKLVPVASPVVPTLSLSHDAPKTSDDSGIGTVESNSFSEVLNVDELKSRKSNTFSFQEDPTIRNKEHIQEYPKIGSQIMKKYDLSKVGKMASISEEPVLEMNRSEELPDKFYDLQESPVKAWNGHSRSHSSFHFGSLNERGQNGNNLRTDTTPKRKRSASGKALRKIWSLAMPENPPDFLDQVIDEDSLIGLTEEELIARQLRTRSIRKVVQQRMKEKVAL